MSELLDCPFCGAGRPRVDSRIGGFEVSCSPGCGASGPNRFMKEEAVSAWNLRAGPTFTCGTVFWLAGRHDVAGSGWEILGLYADERAAVARCIRPNDFIGPLALGERLPEERVDWPGVRYPRTE